eukprot:6485011-Amphidinium_carterae.1
MPLLHGMNRNTIVPPSLGGRSGAALAFTATAFALGAILGLWQTLPIYIPHKQLSQRLQALLEGTYLTFLRQTSERSATWQSHARSRENL